MMAVPSSAQLRRAAKTQRSTALAASALVLAWIGYQAVWPNVAPASYWFQVDRVEVLDAEALAPPPMIVERQIRRAFRATWVVTVMREGAKGFYTFCTARGENDYWPGNALPDVLNSTGGPGRINANSRPGATRSTPSGPSTPSATRQRKCASARTCLL